MPELAGLLGERGDQMRVAVAERIDGDAAGEIEISVAILFNQPDTFAPLESQGRARKGLVKRRTAHRPNLRVRISGIDPSLPRRQTAAPERENQKAAPGAAFGAYIRFFRTHVNVNTEKCRPARRHASVTFRGGRRILTIAGRCPMIYLPKTAASARTTAWRCNRNI